MWEKKFDPGEWLFVYNEILVLIIFFLKPPVAELTVRTSEMYQICCSQLLGNMYNIIVAHFN